jgi:hypothetical protein
MAEMSALLRIIARAEGKEAIEGVARSLGNLQRSGANTTRALEGIASSAGGLAGSMRSLVPLLSGAGLMSLAQRAIKTGDKLYDLSLRTGVSVERLSQFSKAAQMSGSDLDTVAMAMGRMSRSMVAASDNTKAMADRQERDTRRAVEAVQRGERAQTQLVREQADARLAVLDRESDARLRALGRRYRAELQLLSDQADDRQGEQERQLQAQEDAETRAAQRRFDAQRRAITADKALADEARQAMLESLRDQEDQAVGVIRDAYALRSRELQRSFRDQRQEQQDAIDDRRSQEERAIRDSVDRRKSGIRAETDATIEGLKAVALAKIEALKGGASTGDDVDGFNASKAARAYKELGIAVVDTTGKLRDPGDVLLDLATKFSKMADGADKAALSQQLLGRDGTRLIPMLNMGGEAISRIAQKSTAYAKQSDNLNDQMNALSGRVGAFGGKLAVALMPSLEAVTNSLIGMIDAFNRLDPRMQAVIGYGAAIAIAWGPLMGIIINTAKAFALLQGGIALLAGSSIVVGIVVGIKAALGGLLAWVGSTFVPAMAAFFSGPAGWIALASVAVIGLVTVFRKPIIGFLSWLGQEVANGVKGLLFAIKSVFVDPFVNIWNNTLKEPIAALWKWLSDVATTAFTALYAIAWQIFVQPFINLWEDIKDPIFSFMEYMKTAFDVALKAVMKILHTVYVQPWIDLWNTVLREPVTAAWDWLKKTWSQISIFFTKNVTMPISDAWTKLTTGLKIAMVSVANFLPNLWNNVVNSIKSTFNGFISSIFGSLQSVTNQINRAIATFNRLPGPDITPLPNVNIPRFATGAYVTGPTIAQVGEGGQPEYVIPSSKMASASTAYLGGARGVAVLNGSAPGGGRPVVNIQTGPVMQQADGSRWVSLDDAAAMVRQAVDQLRGELAQPSFRAALGVG